MIRTKIIYRVYGPKGKAILATPKRGEAYKAMPDGGALFKQLLARLTFDSRTVLEIKLTKRLTK